MKLTGWISTAVLSLTFAASIAMYAQEQHDQQEEQKEKPAEQKEKKTQPAKPAKQEEKSTAPRNDAKQQEQKSTAQHNDTKQQERTTQPQNKNAEQPNKTAQPEQQAAHQQQQQQHSSHAAPVQEAQHGGRIPDDRFRAHFGQEHRFRVTEANYSSHRFQYGGYWFGFVDPWPSNWLYTQDVYVVDIDGVYYLCNAMYPGVNIALSVTL